MQIYEDDISKADVSLSLHTINTIISSLSYYLTNKQH